MSLLIYDTDRTRDHSNDTGHSASIDDFCNLYKVGNELDSFIHESLLILRDHPTLNQQNSSLRLCLCLTLLNSCLLAYIVNISSFGHLPLVYTHFGTPSFTYVLPIQIDCFLPGL